MSLGNPPPKVKNPSAKNPGPGLDRSVDHEIPVLIKLPMEFLRAAIAAGSTPQIAASGATVLRGDGRKFKQLVNSAGKLTDAGRLYQGETRTVLDTNSYDTAQAPRREGNAEYISMRRGQDKVVRRWDAAMSKWSYTAIGKNFFAQKRINYVVKVPATFAGHRANGTPYIRQGYFPLNEPIAIKMTDSQAQRDEKIKARVRSLYPDGVLAEYSEETITIREGAEWQILEMTTEPGAAGEAPVTDVTERPLAGHPSVSSLPCPEALCSAAFEDDGDKMCCARQIAQVKKRTWEEVADELDLCEVAAHGTNTWRERGATSRMIFEYAKRHDYGAACFHHDHLVERWPGRAPLVWTIHENHAFFYEGVAVLRKLMSRRPPTGAVKVRREARESTTPPVKEWEPWCCAKPGFFWVYEEDIDKVRGEFLAQGRHPKVVLKDASRIKSLRYTFCKRAGDQEHKGVCVVNALPQDWQEIAAWMENLDCGITYKGEGLAGACYKAFVTLIKKKDRVYLTGTEKNELLEQYGYACALCGAKENLEWDHITALSTSFGEQAFEPICAQCHNQKTCDEPRNFDSDPLVSHFCPGVRAPTAAHPQSRGLFWELGHLLDR